MTARLVRRLGGKFRSQLRSCALGLLLPAATLLGSVVTTRDACAIEPRTRNEIITMSQAAMGFSYWWGHGRFSYSASVAKGSCSGNCGSCTHSGAYGGDCSGLAAKVWQIPGPTAFDDDEHPYATTHFRNNTTHWTPITRASAKRGDAFTYNVNGAGHIFVYESDDQAGKVVAYECIGCSYGCQHRTRSYSDKPYIVIRRNSITETADPDPEPEPPPPPTTPTLAAKFIGQGSSLGPPDTGIYQWNTCTNEAFSFYFEVANTSDVAWTDTSGSSWGSSVRLGATDDIAGPLTPGVTRVSVSETANTAVTPTGGDCNDADGCKRVRFDIDGKTPSKPGVYRTSWRLVDEGRGWFGPVMYLDFTAQDCGTEPPPAGGSGGTSSGASGSGGTASGAGGTSSGKGGTGGTSSGKGGTGGTSSSSKGGGAGTGTEPPPEEEPVDPGFEPVEDGDGDTPPPEDPPPGEEEPIPEDPNGAEGTGGTTNKPPSARRNTARTSAADSGSEGACAIGTSTAGSSGVLSVGLVAAFGALVKRRSRSRKLAPGFTRKRGLPSERVLGIVLGLALFGDRAIADVVAGLHLALGPGGSAAWRGAIARARERVGDGSRGSVADLRSHRVGWRSY